MGEDEIEDSYAPLDVFNLVFPAIAKVPPAARVKEMRSTIACPYPGV